MTIPAPTALSAAIDAYVQALRQHSALSGQIIVERDGKIVVQRNYGMAANTPFCIASITKTFTAAAIETLEQHGRLHLDDSVAKYIPNFPNGKAITIRMLLLHRGGLSNPDYPALVKRTASLDDVVASIAGKPALFARHAGALQQRRFRHSCEDHRSCFRAIVCEVHCEQPSATS